MFRPIFNKKAVLASILLFVMFMAYSQNSFSQTTSADDLVKLTEKVYGSDQRIINGETYQFNRWRVKGHPYFINDEWQIGKIFIKEKVFDNLYLKYDIERNNFVLKTENGDGSSRHILLNSSNIDSLVIDGHFFVNVENLYAQNEYRFLEKVYSGQYNYFIRHSIESTHKLKGKIKEKVYLNPEQTFFILKDGEFYNIKTSKDIKSFFGENNKSVSQFLNNSKISLKKATLNQLVTFSEYIEKILPPSSAKKGKEAISFAIAPDNNEPITTISSSENGSSWKNFVSTIKSKNNINVYYNPSDIKDFTVNVKNDGESIQDVLNNNLNIKKIYATKIGEGEYVLTKKDYLNTDLANNFFNKEKAIVAQTSTTSSIEANSQFIKTSTEYIAKNYTVGSTSNRKRNGNAVIRGYAKNGSTGEPIPGANIIDEKSGQGVATDGNGYYEITLPVGKHVLLVKAMNIEEEKLEVNLLSDGQLDLTLEDKVIMLEGVTITGNSTNKVKGTQMGLEKLSAKSVKKIPLAFGEKDIIKVALLLPGVQTVGEGSAGFNVRGSPTDQNLFYINKVPIYNTSHVNGFFSAFNSDAIDEFSLYKSNIPVNYGGRLSSIFDIKTKQGNKNELTGNGGISLITGRLMVEGPIQKDKSSFLVGVRSTYSDWAIDMMFEDKDIVDSEAKFSDAVTNFSFQLNEKNLVNLFTYYSSDKMNLVATQTKYNYENIGASVEWKRFIKKKHTFELSLAHSYYDFNKEEAEIAFSAFKQNYTLQHSEVKANLILKPNDKHTIILGASSTLYNVDRGSRLPLNDSSLVKSTYLGKEKGLESGLYISDEWKVLPKLTVNAGIRYNIYGSMGPQDALEYAEGLPKIEDNVVDTLRFGSGEFSRTYSGLDFRAGLRYGISDDVSVKLSYNRLHQYIYMLSNTIAVSPDYTWKLVDYNTEPIIGDQFSAGIFANLSSNAYEVSLEAYYKKVQNLVQIKDGQEFSLSKFIEQNTLQGDLNSYGLELMIKKNRGNLTGWLNYTYLNTEVKIDSEFPENRINYGQPYPSNFDKPHSLNLVASYNFSRRVNMSTNVVYSTGRPITYPTGYYYYQGVRHYNYSKRNEYRIPDYFRLDLSFTFEGSLKKNKVAHSSWSLSIYNLLGIKNPYSIYFTQEEGKLKGYKLSIFGAPIVSLTYNFKLGNYEN